MSQIDDATCLPCPFCGFRPKADDDDFCYPILRDRSLWGAHCYETGGGCAAQVCANSRDEAIAAWNTRAHASPGPEVAIPLLLFCPACNLQHIDRPQPEKDWTNPPHRSHECQGCGYVWRPSDHATTGVESIATRGKGDRGALPYRESMPAPPEVAAAIELTDAQVDAAIIRANMDAHKGPFVPIGELTAEQLWAYYRSIARHFYALGLAARASPGPEVAQDQLAATPLPKGEQRAFVEGAGGSAATHEVAAAIERVREYTRDMSPEFHSDVILVCTAASRAPGPKKWPTVLSDEDVERISIDTVLTMGNPESRMALAHAMIRAGFRAALIRESRSGIAKAMTAHDAAEAAPGADHV